MSIVIPCRYIISNTTPLSPCTAHFKTAHLHKSINTHFYSYYFQSILLFLLANEYGLLATSMLLLLFLFVNYFITYFRLLCVYFFKKIFFRLFALWIIYECMCILKTESKERWLHSFAFPFDFSTLDIDRICKHSKLIHKTIFKNFQRCFDKSNVNSNKRWKNVPVFGSSRSISLPSIFEPITNLCWCQTSRLGQFAFFSWIWIRILKVPFAQKAACSLFKAMCLLFTIPNGAWQRELFPNTIFINGTCNNGIWPI